MRLRARLGQPLGPSWLHPAGTRACGYGKVGGALRCGLEGSPPVEGRRGFKVWP